MQEINLRRICPCGSGLPKRNLTDARGISCACVCDACERIKRAGCRPEIFTDSNCHADEPIEEE